VNGGEGEDEEKARGQRKIKDASGEEHFSLDRGAATV